MLFAAVKQSDKPSKPAPEWKLRVPNKRFEGGYSHTKFAAYMKSPWEFYLSYVLKMEKVDAQKSELDAAQFGTLFHKAFFKFAKSAAADSANADEIRRALLDAFDETAIDAFGRRPRAQVRIQLENLRNRLSACAEIQARHRAAGWRITAAEKPFATEISGEKFSGTFDRIDENESDGSLLVLDYKTYDKCRRGVARDSHLKMKTDGAIEWESLQLPLYARALREERPDTKISAAFFVAPKDTASTQVDFWDNVADFETPALEKAAEIIAAIRAGNFAPGKPPEIPRIRRRLQRRRRNAQKHARIRTMKERPEIFKNERVSASAGSGKTYALTNRFIALAANAKDPETGLPDPSRITALTFTRKSAGEFLGKILTRLAEAAEDDKAADALSDEVEKLTRGHEVGGGFLTRQDALALLRQCLTNLDKLRLSTIDSFFSSILKCFSNELSIFSEIKIDDEISHKSAAEKIVGEILREKSSDRKTFADFSEIVKRASFGVEEKSMREILLEKVFAAHGKILETPNPLALGKCARNTRTRAAKVGRRRIR